LIRLNPLDDNQDVDLMSQFIPFSHVLPLALAAATSLALAPSPCTAQTNDMFPTKEAAQKRGQALQCSGSFAMGKQWMPCQDFSAYEKAVNQQK
jgi:hypothetical protein